MIFYDNIEFGLAIRIPSIVSITSVDLTTGQEYRRNLRAN